MKKFLTLALLAVSLLTANAESRKWDFTKWSAATIANLNKGASANFSSDAEALNPACGWSDIEKANGTQANAQGGKQFWEVKAQGSSAGTQLCADGEPIQEFEGLLYVNTNARSLAIAIDKGDGYEGPSYVWTGSSKKNYFVIPNVKAGAKITLGVESHKVSEARGYELYITPKGKYTTKGTKLLDEDGKAIPAPKTYVEQTWVVPEEGLTDTPNEDGTYDVLIYNTNGCHCYFINVDEGDNMGEARKVAWLNAGGAGLDFAMRPTDGFEYTDFDLTSQDINEEELRSYDAVVLGSDLTSELPSYSTLEKNIAFVPMVNLNKNLFGYTPVENGETNVTVANAEADYWTNISVEEGAFDYQSNLAVTLPEKFADDEVLAKQGDAVFSHRHNNGAGKNSYLLLPSDETSIAGFSDWPSLLGNYINEAAKTKRDVTNAAAPSIALSYADQKTTVTISCATGGSKVYYKVGDGDYQLYTEPLEYTEETTLTAYAVSEGFLQSEEATKVIDIQTQAAAPEVNVDMEDGKSIITINNKEEGAKVYYSFSGQTKAANAATYTDAVEVTEPGEVSAFAVLDGKLQSELTQVYVHVKGIPEVKDTISHFTANEADWFTNAEVTDGEGNKSSLAEAISAGTATGNAKAVYYFGKSAWSYYSDEIDHTEKDPETGDDVIIYKPAADALRIVSSTSDTDWVIKSNGQVITGETNVAAGSGVFTGTTGYFAEEAVDEIGGVPSKGKVDFGGKSSGDPYTMRIESTKKFEGTFDVVTYLSNGGTSDLGIEIQKSADGENWETVGQLNYSKTQRLFKKTRAHVDATTPVYIRVAQVSGGSKGQLYDIYIISTEGTSTGINNVATAETKTAKVQKFSKNGQIYIKKGDALYNVAGLKVQ